MAETSKRVQTWQPNVPAGLENPATKYGGQDAPGPVAGKESRGAEEPNPSDPGNTGTTPGTNADVG